MKTRLMSEEPLAIFDLKIGRAAGLKSTIVSQEPTI